MTTSVLLCGRTASPTPTIVGDAEVTVVEDLCRRPGQLVQLAESADRLVLGVCLSEVSLGVVQAEARHAGIDPLGVEVVDLESVDPDPDRLDLVFNARAARASAFAGSRPEHSKISIPAKVSRRDLIHRRVHEYIAAPTIEPSTCAASSGCRACVDVCPRQALTWSAGAVTYDRVACEPCGRCVTACPTGAVVNPATTPGQLEAEISTLLDPSIGPPGPRGIVFTCSRGRDAAPAAPGWYPVSLPCVGMATPAWLLAPLLMGAGNVAASPCHDTGCPLGHGEIIHAIVDFCRELLSAAGESPERVSVGPASELLVPLLAVELSDPFGLNATPHIVEAFASISPSPSAIVVESAASPLGIIQIDERTCTACTLCARSCPTEALQFVETAEMVTVTFEASACVACGQCTDRCPELERGAIELHRRTDWTALHAGRVELMSAEVVSCESCGATIAPKPALDRISALLAPEDGPIADLLQRRCMDCRSKAPVA